MLEVRGERRPYFYEERLEFFVLRARNQRLVDRIENRLVILDFMVDVSLVELGAAQRFQMGQVLLAAGLEALAGGVVLWQ
jgi:hypothetical protein